MIKAAIAAIALAASSTTLAAQGLKMPTGSDGLGLRVSQAVEAQLMPPPPPLNLSLPRGYTISPAEIPPTEEKIDPIGGNVASLKYHDPCRDPEKTFAQNARCQISQGDYTDSIAGRDARDWQYRKNQVEFTNNFAKKFLGNTVSVTEGTPTQPSKIVWFQHWKPRLKFETPNGRFGYNLEIGYYLPF